MHRSSRIDGEEMNELTAEQSEPAVPTKQKKTPDELATMIHHDLSQIEGCPQRGVKVTFEGDLVDGVQLISFNSTGASLTNTEIETGRMFTETEDNRRVEVVVLGADLKNRFFPNVDSIGKTVQCGENFLDHGVDVAAGWKRAALEFLDRDYNVVQIQPGKLE